MARWLPSVITKILLLIWKVMMSICCESKRHGTKQMDADRHRNTGEHSGATKTRWTHGKPSSQTCRAVEGQCSSRCGKLAIRRVRMDSCIDEFQYLSSKNAHRFCAGCCRLHSHIFVFRTHLLVPLCTLQRPIGVMVLYIFRSISHSPWARTTTRYVS